MDLADILGREQIVPELKATNRWEAIDELIGNLVATGKIQPGDRDAITAAVKKRETSMSTGIGFGIGIPHASTDLIYEVVGALGRSQEGVNFDALDNQPVKLVMLFLVPQGQFQKHLHTLANIAKLLHKAEFRQALEQAPDADGHARHHPGIREINDVSRAQPFPRLSGRNPRASVSVPVSLCFTRRSVVKSFPCCRTKNRTPIATAVRAVLPDADVSAVLVRPCPDPKFGDYQ